MPPPITPEVYRDWLIDILNRFGALSVDAQDSSLLHDDFSQLQQEMRTRSCQLWYFAEGKDYTLFFKLDDEVIASHGINLNFAVKKLQSKLRAHISRLIKEVGDVRL